MSYKGIYKLKNPSKYIGDPSNIVFRSLWEKQVMKWCEENINISQWASESIIIPYYYPVDGKTHRYFVDFFISFKDGNKLLVEIKPDKQTKTPIRPRTMRRPTPRFLAESMVYIRNISKWKAADEYAKKRGWQFSVWTENTLKSLGIKIIASK